LSLVFLRKPVLKNREREWLKIVFFIFLWIFSAGFILAEEKININTASHEELQGIIWVGPVTAQKIIDARPFYSLDEIVKVSGIGDKKLEDIKKQGIAWIDPILKDETKILSGEIKKDQSADPVISGDNLRAERKEGDPLIIDINTASLQELQKIVGIGAVLGQRIIDARPFYSLDEIVKVSGIGETLLENIKKQGLAWVDPEITLSKAEKIDYPNKELATVFSPLQEKQQVKDKKYSKKPPVILTAFFLSFFSGIIVLILKKNLKNFS